MRIARRILPRKYMASFEDFRVLTHERKADLLDGIIWVAPPERKDTVDLWQYLRASLQDYAKKLTMGDVYGPRVAFRLNQFNAPEPDLAFLSKDRSRLRRANFISGPPDLVMEIVTLESIQRDYVLKRRLYERFGVREYWIIDDAFEKIVLLRLTTSGKYRRVRPTNDRFESQVIPGFSLAASILWKVTARTPPSLVQESGAN
jgi:Uma2 family endonuclease